MFVHVVIGEFDFFKRDDLLSKLFALEWRIRMDVKSSWSWWISFSGHQPRTPVIGVSVPLIVHGNDIHQNGVMAVGPQSTEGHPAGWKHSPVKKKTIKWYVGQIIIFQTPSPGYIFISFTFQI